MKMPPADNDTPKSPGLKHTFHEGIDCWENIFRDIDGLSDFVRRWAPKLGLMPKMRKRERERETQGVDDASFRCNSIGQNASGMVLATVNWITVINHWVCLNIWCSVWQSWYLICAALFDRKFSLMAFHFWRTQVNQVPSFDSLILMIILTLRQSNMVLESPHL